jgi:undecaprenyl-diphosphatase
MTRKGSPAARLKPGCVLFALAFALSAAGRGETLLALGEAPRPPQQPLIRGTVSLLGSYGVSPLRLRWDEVNGAAALGTAVVLLAEGDQTIARAFDSRQDWLDRSMPIVSDLGEGWAEAIVVLGAWALGGERARQTSAQGLQVLALSGIYTAALKAAAWSVRPGTAHDDHRYFAYDQSTQSMPSGHTFSAFALAEVYGAEYGRLWTYPFAVLMAYSRLYNRAHWASDVTAGAILGIAAGYQVRQRALTLGQPQWDWQIQAEKGVGIQVSQAF